MTQALARLGAEDQDLINDFLHHLAVTGQTMKGSYLAKLIERVVEGNPDPLAQDVQGMLPGELLKAAREWRDGE